MTLKEYLQYRKIYYKTVHFSRAEIKFLTDSGMSLKKGWKERYANIIIPDLMINCLDQNGVKLIINEKNVKGKIVKKRYKNKKETQAKRIPTVVGEEYRKISNQFLSSNEWFKVRYLAIKRDKGKCCVCGVSAKDGAIIQVDHIKSRYLYPELSLDLNNLQTICKECNMGKGYQDETKWN